MQVFPPNEVRPDQRVPIKVWASNLEAEAWGQAYNLAALPFTFRHVALMPDAHVGYGMPIGGVLATKQVIIPNAVGVDIGCGMCAVRTDWIDPDQQAIKNIMGLIREVIPVGFNHHEQDQQWDGFVDSMTEMNIIKNQLGAARKQLGTLGGGNHFIELQRDEEYYVWIMIHSGSRNFGFKIANHYHDLAKRRCAQWFAPLPTEDLAFLPIDSV